MLFGLRTQKILHIHFLHPLNVLYAYKKGSTCLTHAPPSFTLGEILHDSACRVEPSRRRTAE